MNEDIRNIDLQELINKKIKEDGLDFDCPHCGQKINEALFGRDGQNFRLFINKCKEVAKEQWLKQVEESKKYEEFGGFVKLKNEVKEKDESIEKLTKKIAEIELNFAKDLAKATSYDEIKKLDGFKDLENKVKKLQEEKEVLIKGNQPEIKSLREKNEKLEKELSENKLEYTKNLTKATSFEEVKKLPMYKELEERLTKSQKEKEEKEKENDKLRYENQTLVNQGRMSKKKGEDLEKYVLEQLQTTYNGSDEISKITHVGEKADIIHEIYKEEQQIAKIIYEIKNVDKWDDKWLEKLEKDMVNDKADYGIIVSTYRQGNPLWKPFRHKNILVSDDENFIFASQMARLLILSKRRFQEGEKPEERVKKLEEWVREKLPNYLLKLEQNFNEWEKDLGRINTSVKSMEKIRGNIKQTVISQMEIELKNI